MINIGPYIFKLLNNPVVNWREIFIHVTLYIYCIQYTCIQYTYIQYVHTVIEIFPRYVLVVLHSFRNVEDHPILPSTKAS